MKTSNTGCLLLFSGGFIMLPASDVPLFTFEYDVIYWCNRFWLVELCVWWNGDTQIMEMVEIQENIDDYVS